MPCDVLRLLPRRTGPGVRASVRSAHSWALAAATSEAPRAEDPDPPLVIAFALHTRPLGILVKHYEEYEQHVLNLFLNEKC